MKEILTLLEMAESHLAKAKMVLESVDSAKTEEALASCDVLVEKHQQFEAKLNTMKTALLAGLAKADFRIAKQSQRWRTIDVPGWGTVTVHDGDWLPSKGSIYPPGYNSRTYLGDWKPDFFVTSPETGPHFWEVCRAFLASIQGWVTKAAESTHFENEAATVAKTAQELTALVRVLKTEVKTPA